MREQKLRGELNRERHPEEMRQLWNIARAAGIREIVLALVLTVGGLFSLSVKSEPATLRSPDATVYEQTSEGSNPIGNIVEGGSFEYIGDVTAEDGSMWHQITTTGGVIGYIRGDREIETGKEGRGEGGGQPAQANPPEGEFSEENFLGDNAEAGQNPGEAGSSMDNEAPGEAESSMDSEAPGEAEGSMGSEAPEEGEEEEAIQDSDGETTEEDAVVPAFHMQNNQAKKYVVEGSQKIKERGSHAQMTIDTEEITGKRTGVDLTLVAAIIVMFICSGIIYVCGKRIKQLRRGSREAFINVPDGNKPRGHRKVERKKHSQKKKSTRIIQGKKRN